MLEGGHVTVTPSLAGKRRCEKRGFEMARKEKTKGCGEMESNECKGGSAGKKLFHNNLRGLQ